MGTRHFQKVITKEGETKVKQYGQWDGYPSGQGIDILKFLAYGNLDMYQERLSKLRQPTNKEVKDIEKYEDWPTTHPYLSRDCGAKIHELITMGSAKFVVFMDESEARQWCEGFYTIDFSKNEFTSEFNNIRKVYPIDKLPSRKKYLKDMDYED